MTLETAGAFLMRVRDIAIATSVALLDGRLKSPEAQELARAVATLPPEVRERVVIAVVDDLLVALLSALDEQDEVTLIANGASVADKSDGLAGELFTDRGWIERMSRYPPSTS